VLHKAKLRVGKMRRMPQEHDFRVVGAEERGWPTAWLTIHKVSCARRALFDWTPRRCCLLEKTQGHGAADAQPIVAV